MSSSVESVDMKLALLPIVVEEPKQPSMLMTSSALSMEDQEIEYRGLMTTWKYYCENIESMINQRIKHQSICLSECSSKICKCGYCKPWICTKILVK